MRKRRLSQEWLKLIACATMLIDHIGAVLLPQHIFLRCIGRIAFPIYCFLLAEGVHYTKNPKNYAKRLGIGVILSEIPFDLALFGGLTVSYQSVMLTLFIAFWMAMCIKRINYPVIQILIVIPFAFAAEWLRTDYGGMGVVLVALFVLTREWESRGVVQLLGMIPILWLMDSAWVSIAGLRFPVEMLALLAMVPIGLYSGEKMTAKPAVQRAFYLFYPTHLTTLYFLRLL